MQKFNIKFFAATEINGFMACCAAEEHILTDT
jgi:hypothetical protein